MVTDEARSMLLELADFLDALPWWRFDYKFWIGREWRGEPDLSCGTSACAGGWATTLPRFKERGLFLSSNASAPAVINLESGYEAVGVDALARVLGVEYNDAMVLFIPDTYDEDLDLRSPTDDAPAQEVAEHIREWLQAKDRQAVASGTP
jgi:hypothetical protein